MPRDYNVFINIWRQILRQRGGTLHDLLNSLASDKLACGTCTQKSVASKVICEISSALSERMLDLSSYKADYISINNSPLPRERCDCEDHYCDVSENKGYTH